MSAVQRILGRERARARLEKEVSGVSKELRSAE